MIEVSPPDWSQRLPSLRWFRFQHSVDYSRRQKEFAVLQNTGDTNLLLLFLSVHPSHLDSLLYLADLFARLGEMERAADLVRRCLYYHEASYASTFLPCRGASHHPCCLSFLQRENQSYFRALFLHFQLAWMKGFLSVATDILKVILSLEPLTDPMHTLLLLDKLLLMGGRYEEIDHFCQLPASRALALPVSTACEASGEQLLLSDIFPNWAYSLALAHRLNEAKTAEPPSLRDPHRSAALPRPADELLLSALRRFPFFVWELLEGTSLSGPDKQLWESLQDHKFFRHFSSLDRSGPPLPLPCFTQRRLHEPLGSDTIRVLSHLSLCARRSFSVGSQTQDSSLPTHLWCHPANLSWLLSMCRQLTSQLGDAETVSLPISLPPLPSRQAISRCESELKGLGALLSADNRNFLERYLTCPLEIFQEEFPRLPAEANPLNPALLDPRILERGYVPPPHTLEVLAQYGVGSRNRTNRIPKTIERMMTPGGAIELAVLGGVVNTEAIMAELNLLRERGLRGVEAEEFLSQISHMNTPLSRRGNLDPRLPLLQLFLATLLPWYRLDRSGSSFASSRR
jgi:hypothetical protein